MVNAVHSTALGHKFLKKVQSHQNDNVSAQLNNSYELPRYNVSFGMAKIDLSKYNLREVNNSDERSLTADEKYFTPDSNGNIPAAKMESEELERLVNEYEKKEPSLIIKLFTAANEKGELIAHNPKIGVLDVLNESISSMKEGKKLLDEIYTTPDKAGNLPAHNYDLYDLKKMIKVLDEESVKEVLMTPNDKGQLVAHHPICKEDGILGYIVDCFEDEPDFVKRILNYTDKKGNKPLFMGAKDFLSFYSAFEDDKKAINNQFIEKKGQKYLKHFWSENIYPSEKSVMFNMIHNKLFNNHPEILKDLYTLKDENNFKFSDLEIPAYASCLAENMLELAASPQLSDEDSLEILAANRDFLIANSDKDINAIIRYFIRRVSKR